METNLLWSKKRDVTHGGVQLTSFGPKNVTLLTGGSNWPFRCLDVFNQICTIGDQVNEEAEKLRLVPKLDL